MKRSLIVVLVGFAMTLLLTSLGTGVVLSLSPGWRAVVGNAPKGFGFMMLSLVHSIRALVAFVYLPTALLVGFWVGLFSGKRKISSAIIATGPAWVPLSAVPPWGTLMSMFIAGAAAFGAWLSKRAGTLKPG
jgi:hypothetical protein